MKLSQAWKPSDRNNWIMAIKTVTHLSYRGWRMFCLLNFDYDNYFKKELHKLLLFNGK